MFYNNFISRSSQINIGLSVIGIYKLLQYKLSPSHCLSDRVNTQKLIAGHKSVDDFVKSGMIVSLGTGTTVQYATYSLSQKLKSGELKNIQVLPCSDLLRKQCISLHIPTISFSEVSEIDLAIDGVDEVDSQLNSIKGSSGSILRENRMQKMAKSVIVVCDETKLTKKLGPGVPLPVEVTVDELSNVINLIESLPSLQGIRPMIRHGNVNNIWIDGFDYAVTDNGNFIIDLYFDRPIIDPEKVAYDLNTIPGVVAHGLIIHNNKTKFLIASNRGVKIASTTSENEIPWWDELQTKQPLDRKRIDNIIPPKAISSNIV